MTTKMSLDKAKEILSYVGTKQSELEDQGHNKSYARTEAIRYCSEDMKLDVHEALVTVGKQNKGGRRIKNNDSHDGQRAFEFKEKITEQELKIRLKKLAEDKHRIPDDYSTAIIAGVTINMAERVRHSLEDIYKEKKENNYWHLTEKPSPKPPEEDLDDLSSEDIEKLKKFLVKLLIRPDKK